MACGLVDGRAQPGSSYRYNINMQVHGYIKKTQKSVGENTVLWSSRWDVWANVGRPPGGGKLEIKFRKSKELVE